MYDSPQALREGGTSMRNRRRLATVLLAFVFCASSPLAIAGESPKAGPRLLVRIDDIGFCHSINVAAKTIVESGLPVSISTMFAGPWYQDAVAGLKDAPNVAIGLHAA